MAPPDPGGPPCGAAHRHRSVTIRAAGEAISKNLAELIGVDGAVLRQQRREKFLKMGEAAGL